MTDLKSPIAIWIKGILFLVIGVISTALVIVPDFTLQRTLLVLVAIWAFYRFYYFTFYVIQNYVDDGYRYAGLLDFLFYASGVKKAKPISRILTSLSFIGLSYPQ